MKAGFLLNDTLSQVYVSTLPTGMGYHVSANKQNPGYRVSSYCFLNKMNSPKPSEPSLKILLTHFKWSLDRFEEILQNEKTEYYRDAALQRFSFTCDMALKCIRSLAVEQGNDCETFLQCIEWLEEKNWLEKSAPWKELTDSCLRASQKLNGESADQEYDKLESYYRLLKNIYERLETL